MRALVAPAALAGLLALAGPVATPTASAVTAPAATTPTTTTSTAPVPQQYVSILGTGKRVQGGVLVRTQQVVLISGTGERRVLLESRVRRSGGGYLTLGDTSADGRTVLALRWVTPRRQEAIAVDVATGAQRRVDLGRDTTQAVLTPDGAGVVVGSYDKSAGRGVELERRGFDGSTTPLGRAAGSVMRLDDRSVLTGSVSPAAKAVLVIDAATGAVLRRVPTTGGYCTPVRRWDTTRVLLTCSKRGRTLLSTLDTATGAQAPVTVRHPRRRGMQTYGDLDARVLAGRTFVEAGARCGAGEVAEQQADGELRRLALSGERGEVGLVGTDGAQLLLERYSGCNTAGSSSLVRWDPATGAETVLLALGRRALLGPTRVLGEPQASFL